jgi:hypothetical protein
MVVLSNHTRSHNKYYEEQKKKNNQSSGNDSKQQNNGSNKLEHNHEQKCKEQLEMLRVYYKQNPYFKITYNDFTLPCGYECLFTINDIIK